MNPFPLIQGIRVDLKALLSIDHQCVPLSCMHKKICCASYQICIEEEEMEKIIPLLPEAAKYAYQIVDGDSFVNIFEEIEDGLIEIETNDKDQCMLSCKGEKGELLCSLHCQALKNKVSPHAIKPKSCNLWPLAEVEGAPPLLTIQDDVLEFVCNKKREKGKTINAVLMATIENVYGRKFLETLNQKISEMF